MLMRKKFDSIAKEEINTTVVRTSTNNQRIKTNTNHSSYFM